MVRDAYSFHLEAAACIEHMIARKNALFGDDNRVIGQFKVRIRDGEPNLWAEARTPWPAN